MYYGVDKYNLLYYINTNGLYNLKIEGIYYGQKVK